MNDQEKARFDELNKKDDRTPEEETEHRDLKSKKQAEKK